MPFCTESPCFEHRDIRGQCGEVNLQSPRLLVRHMANSLEVEVGPRELGTEAQRWHSGKTHLCNGKGSFQLPSVLGRLPEAMGIAVVQSGLRKAEYCVFIIPLLLFSSTFTNFLFQLFLL